MAEIVSHIMDPAVCLIWFREKVIKRWNSVKLIKFMALNKNKRSSSIFNIVIIIITSWISRIASSDLYHLYVSLYLLLDAPMSRLPDGGYLEACGGKRVSSIQCKCILHLSLYSVMFSYKGKISNSFRISFLNRAVIVNLLTHVRYFTSAAWILFQSLFLNAAVPPETFKLLTS
jgi:hypothetical protein